jgi:hypothetical protein
MKVMMLVASSPAITLRGLRLRTEIVYSDIADRGDGITPRYFFGSASKGAGMLRKQQVRIGGHACR